MNTHRTLLGSTLLLACGLAIAQSANDPKSNPPTGNQDSAAQATRDINSQDQGNGNDLNAHKATGEQSNDSDPAKTHAIDRQDTASGNNLSANAKKADKSFDELDTRKTGALSRADAKRDAWLSKNFGKCDRDRNGSVSREEYEACSQSG